MKKNIEVIETIGGGKAGNKQTQPRRDSVTASTEQRATVLYGLQEGECLMFKESGNQWLKNVYLDGTPVMSEDGTMLLDVEADYRRGTADQTPIDGMPSVVVDTAVNVEVRSGAPVTRSFTNADATAYDVRLSIPQLFDGNEKGDSVVATVQIAIDVAIGDNPFELYKEYTITEKIVQGFDPIFTVELEKAPVRTIRVRKITPDKTDEYSSNRVNLIAIAEVIEVRMSYPHTALLWLSFDARQFSNFPKLEVRYFGKSDILMPANYDPVARTYADSGVGTTNGVWNGQWKRGYTDNPMLVWLDMATSERYALGNQISLDLIPKWTIYYLMQVCDELVSDGRGGKEPRFTCNNLYYQTAEDAYKVMKDLLGAIRGMTVWTGEYLTPKIDTGLAARGIKHTFTPANCLNVTFSSTSEAATHNVVHVQYSNREERFAVRTVTESDTDSIRDKGRVDPISLTALGCTSQSQAQRVAKYILLSETRDNTLITLTTGMEGVIPTIGDIFAYGDGDIANTTISGRITDLVGSTIHLDREIDSKIFPVGSTIYINADKAILPELGQESSTSDVLSFKVKSVVAANQLDLDWGADIAPIREKLTDVVKGAVWAIESENVAPMIFEITDLSYDEKNYQWTINGVSYDGNKVLESDGASRVERPPIIVGDENAIISAPQTLVATYKTSIVQDINVCSIDVSWKAVSNAHHYVLEFRKDQAAWQPLGAIAAFTFTMDNVYEGIYDFRVRSVDGLGSYSIYTYSDPLQVRGKVLPPPKLTDYTVSGELFGFTHKWSFPSNTEDSRGVRIKYAEQDPVKFPSTAKYEFDVAYPTMRFEQRVQGSGFPKLWFSAALVDKYGTVGEYTNWIEAQVTSDPEQILEIVQGHIGKEILDKELQDEFVNIDNRITDTKEIADAANNAAIAARDVADNAASAAASANTAANNAQIAANAAKADALKAQQTADTAKADASSALTSAKAAQKSADDLRTEVNTSFNDVTVKYDKAVADLNDGLTVERKARQDGDTKITTDMTAYKLSNDAAVTTALTQSEQAISASSANSTLIQGVQATLNTKNRTYRQATAPTTGLIVGDIWYNTTAGKNSEARRWDGSAWVDLTDPRTALNATAISKTEADVKDLGDKQTATSTKLDGVAANLDSLTKTVDTKVDSAVVTQIQADVKKNKDDISSTSSRVTTVEGNMQTMQGDINKKAENSVVVAQQQQINTIGGKVDTNVKDITSLRSDLTTTQKGLATKVEAAVVDGIDVRLKETEKGLASEVAKTTALESSIGTLIDSVSITGDNNVALDIVPDATFSKGTITSVSAAATGRKAIKAGSGSGTNDQVWARATGMLPFDATRTYRLRARFWRSKGAGKIYVGVAALTSDKKQYITTTGTKSADMGSSTYLYNGLTPAQDVRVEVEYFIKGMTNGAATGSGTIDDPKQMQYDTAYISPMFIAGYQNIAGSTVYFDYVTLELADAMMVNRGTAKAVDQIKLVQDQQGKDITSIAQRTTAVEADLITANNNINNKADASVVNQIKADVQTQGDKITTNTSNITKQETRITAVEKQATDMQANISTNYYTKGQTEAKAQEIAAGVVNTFDASLVIGSANLITKGDGDLRVGSYTQGDIVRSIVDGDIHITQGTTATSWSGWANATTDYSDVINLNTNENFTVTIFIKPKDVTKLPSIQTLAFYLGNGYGYVNLSQNVPFSSAGGEVKFSYTFKKVAALAPIPHFNIVGLVANGGLIITRWKIEKGNKSTDFLTSDKEVVGSLNANAKAIDATNVEVKKVDDKVTSVASRTTLLEAGLVTTNDKVNAKADTTLVNQIKADVESQGSKITANTTNISKQETRLSAVEKQTTDLNASITTNYYTKGQTDDKAKEIAAGVVNVYDASLVIGGVNAVINSEAERSSAASTQREYLMYERSEALKAFYDENLGKPVTVSFEVKMPVAGQLQIYASNGSFHAFEASIQITQVNVWTKVVVTVTPRVNTGNTNPTQSTLEFYGVAYGSGRIPTVRKVQVEAGTKATAWSPSPRDVSASFESTAKAIDLTNVEVKKVGDNVTTLAGRTTTLETKQTDLTKGVEANTKSITTAQGKIETLEGQVKATNETTTELTAQVTNADIIARAMASNNQLVADPTFINGTALTPYSNATLKPTVTRIAKEADNPTKSTHQVEVKITGAANPAYGGFVCFVTARANLEVLTKIIMKVPVGVRVGIAGNAIGTGGTDLIIGNKEGTGRYETYYRWTKCGASGSFANFGHVYFEKSVATTPTPTDAAPWLIEVASTEVYDTSDYKDVSPVIADSMAAIKSTAQTAADTSKANTTEIGKHTSRLDVVEGQVANKLDASFQNTVYTKAQTDAKAKEVASGQITEYNAGLVLSSSNLLMRSNVQAKKVAGSNPYPFASFRSGNGNFVTGKTYTLMFEAEFTKSGTDAGFYAYFGGQQAILSRGSSFTRQIFKTTVTRTATSADTDQIQFYLIPQNSDSSKASTATVYWATLYEGDNPPYAGWMPSQYDTIAYTVFSSSFGGEGQGIKDADAGYTSGWAWTSGSRGIALHTFDSNGVRLASTIYDTYGGAAASTALTNALNALAAGAQVALTSYDAIGAVTADLQTALNSIGVSSLSMPTTSARHVILYVGTKGNAIGSAVEMFSPAGATTPPLSYLLTFNRGKAEGLSGTGGTANVIKQVEASVTEVDGKYIALNKDYTQYKSQVDQNFANIAVTYQTKAAAEQSAANLTTQLTSAYRSEILESVTIKDTRNDNQPPSWYIANFPRRVTVEMKNQSVLGLTGMGSLITLNTTVRWSDATGGMPYQEAVGSGTRLVKYRTATSVSAWGEWVDDLADIDAKINKKLDASVITDYSTTVKMNEAISAATTKVTAEYKADINAIAVGGANLAPNSSFNENLTGWNSNGGTHSIVADATLKNGSTSCWKMVATNNGHGLYQGIGNVISDVGLDVTVSIWARGEVGGEKLNLLSQQHSASTSITLTTTWQRYTFTAKKTAASISLTIYSGAAGTFYLSEYQYERGNKATDWKPYYGDTQKALEANATAVSSLGGRVTTAEGKLVTQADTITQLNTRVGNNETAVQIQGQSIDGINAKYTVKINNNGYMTGYGLISTQVNGVVISAFKIDSDAFIVGKGNQSIAPMVVVTTPQTINGQYYPAGAWFNVAGIVEASIKLAHIDTATIGSLSALSANIGRLESVGANGGKTVIDGAKNEVYYPNGKLCMRWGNW